MELDQSPQQEKQNGKGKGGRKGVGTAGLKALVLARRRQKLGLVLMLRQRLVTEQRKLHQKGVKLLTEEGRRQLLLGWRHQLSSGGR